MRKEELISGDVFVFKGAIDSFLQELCDIGKNDVCIVLGKEEESGTYLVYLPRTIETTYIFVEEIGDILT